MIRTVQCPSCSTSFPVDPRKVPDQVVYARCSACEGIFLVDGGGAAAAAGSGMSATAAPTPEPAGAGVAKPDFAEADLATPAPPTPSLAETAPPEQESARPEFAAEDLGAPAEQSDSPGVAPASPDEWVFETEPEIDPSNLDVRPLDTVEEELRQTQDEPSAPSIAEPAGWAPPPPEPTSPLPAPPPAAPAAPPKGFTFGKRDPHEKASRLARVLVSDIITYNPERHQRALEAGTLKADFEDGIQKSWGEYVDQVGKELAESTQYFNDALNEILARGQRVF